MSHIDRREFIAGTTAAGLSLGAFPMLGTLPPAFAQRKSSPSEKSPAELITPETQRKIDRGLEFLAKRQVKTGQTKGGFGHSGYAGGIAVCSLSGLAFMCSGNPPGQGPYGKHIDMCAEFLLKRVSDAGYISAAGNDNMYGHGFGTLFLGEYYGMTRKEEVGDKLRKAVKLICRCQSTTGGWRYQPTKNGADLSITICQIMGLRAARDAGIHVPDEVRKKCIEYVKKSQNNDGGFRYTINGGGSKFPLTGAGLVSLYSAGEYDTDEVKRGLTHLQRYKPGTGRASSYYFYAHYYAVQAMWHAGGKYWDEWYPAIRDELLKSHRGDGSWVDSQVGPEFGTAMACIILQMPNNYLPVFAP